MGTTPRGIPYPENASLIEGLVPDIKALADGTNAALEALLTAIFGTARPKIQYGQRTISVSGAASGSVVHTFATPFTVSPIVVATCATTTSVWIGAVYGVTSTQCTLQVFHRDGSTGTGTLAVNFLAIGL